MEREDALKMAEDFPAWVPASIIPRSLPEIKEQGSKLPATPREAGILFVRALYAAGYEIRKKREVKK